MKRTSLAVKSILASALVALVASCGDKANYPAPAAAPVEEAPAGCRMKAYFDADSVMRAYVLAQQLTEEGQRMMNRLQQQGAQKLRELEAKAQNIENKRQNNIYLSDASFPERCDGTTARPGRSRTQPWRTAGQLQAAMAASQQRLQ